MFKVLAKFLCIALVSMTCDAFAPIQPFSRTTGAPSARAATKDCSSKLQGLSIFDAQSSRKGLMLANRARGPNILGMTMAGGPDELSDYGDEIKWMPSCLTLSNSEPDGESPVLPLFPLGGYVYLVSLPNACVHHITCPPFHNCHRNSRCEITKTNHFSCKALVLGQHHTFLSSQTHVMSSTETPPQ
jgi:hypothetical protein